MVTAGPQSWVVNIDRWGSICSIVAFISTWSFGRVLLTPAPASALQAGPGRLPTILLLGGLAAAAHGILWSLAERGFAWKFGAGGSRTLPQGWSAALLSLTQTVPLVVVPFAYEQFAGVPITPRRHLLAGACAIAAAVAGNIVMYGTSSRGFRGVRRSISPLKKQLTLKKAVILEAIWALMHFICTAFVYRLVVALPTGTVLSVTIAPALGAMFFFFGIVSFILLRFPGSITERSWIQARGVISGIILLVALEGGMLT
jgi:hypothetical protein